MIERKEIQANILNNARKTITDMGIELQDQNDRQTRRVIRASLRTAARLAVETGCSPEAFLGMALTAFGRELTAKANDLAATESPAETPETNNEETSLYHME